MRDLYWLKSKAMYFVFLSFIAIFTVFLVPPSVSAVTVNLNPTADSMVRVNAPNTNYGTVTELVSQGTDFRVIYMKFDLSSLAGKNITSAKLRVKTDTEGGSQVAHDIKLVANTTWTETGITYANSYASSDTTLRPTTIIATIPTANSTTWIESNITSIVTQKKGALLALAYSPATSSEDAIRILSRETAEKPTLIVDYTDVPTPTRTPTPNTQPISLTPTPMPGFGGITLGQTISGTLYVTLATEPSVTSLVKFYIDDIFINEEAAAPYSLGGDTNGVVNGYDTRLLSNGSHTLKATILFTDGQTQIQQIIFTVNNPPGPTPTCVPRPSCMLPGSPTCTATPALPPGGSWCPIPTTTPVPTIACTALNAVTNLTPNGNVAIASAAATFRWNAVGGATQYAVRIDDLADGFDFDYIAGDCKATSSNDACTDKVTTNSFIFPVQLGHSYRWWVHAINACGNWSTAASVNLTIVQPSATPVMTNTPTPTRTPTPTPSPMAPTISPTPTTPLISVTPGPTCYPTHICPTGSVCLTMTPPPGGFCPYQHAIDFTTNTVSLKADDFYILANGKKYFGDQASLQLHSDPGNATYTSLEATWQENGTPMRMFMYFWADKTKWWAFETRSYDGKNPTGENYYIKNRMETPHGSTFYAYEYIIANEGATSPNDPHIYFRNLRVQAFTNNNSAKPPSVRIIQPSGSTYIVNSTTVDVLYIQGGNLSEVDHVHLMLDNQPEVRDLDNDGKYTFTNVQPGEHTIKIYLAKADHTPLPNPEASFTGYAKVVLNPTGVACPLHPQGDANCDNLINLIDFETWRQEFTATLTTITADFDLSGTVDLIDFETWRQGFVSTIPVPAQ